MAGSVERSLLSTSRAASSFVEQWCTRRASETPRFTLCNGKVVTWGRAIVVNCGVQVVRVVVGTKKDLVNDEIVFGVRFCFGRALQL
mmetsp:Transcript_291/g.546  ORF Transcript_291/g.546 Transcript_291/m.546 type:complete len:87 (-) Transcript_291:660-920(-)